MTPYEAQSLAIAKWQIFSYVAADAIALLALVAAIISGIFAYRNIRIMRGNMLLFLEQDMAARRKAFHDIGAALERPGASVDSLRERFNEAKESYLNAFERLAALVLGCYFPEDEMRRDYHEALRQIIKEFPTDFAAGTPYRKMLKLHERWQDS